MTAPVPVAREPLRYPLDWIVHPKGTYRFPVILSPEGDGGFSVRVATLPGVASQGETEEEALANIKDAMEGTLASYSAHGEKIPWREEEKAKGASRTVWVVAHA
jgi:predicted RNase H-like HicB family nuclease